MPTRSYQMPTRDATIGVGRRDVEPPAVTQPKASTGNNGVLSCIVLAAFMGIGVVVSMLAGPRHGREFNTGIAIERLQKASLFAKLLASRPSFTADSIES